MHYLVTGGQMKAVDRYTIEEIGIPSLVLMERAAAAVAETVVQEAEKLYGGPCRTARKCSIWAVCGTGNNGADGIAAARILHNQGYQVTVILAGDPMRGTKEFQVQKEIAEKLDMQLVEWKDFLPGRCDILIDAVFGVGLGRDVEGEYREVVEMMGQAGAGCVVAVDMPSGIHSDNGQVMGCAVKADVTVTFGYEKRGNVLYPGRMYCGRVVVQDIGFPPQSIQAAGTLAFTCDREDLGRIPGRPEYSNKGTFGKVLVAAGSPGMGGAAYLCAKSAYAMGAGLVKILTVEENRQMLQQLLPEAILDVRGASDEEALRRLVEQECAWADVIVLGPGIGLGEDSYTLVREFLMNAYVPIVLDADGLNVIAAHSELTQYFTENIIITPHLGEMSRLTGKTIKEIQKNLVETAADYSGAYGISCVLKDAATVVTGRENQCYINSSGNSAMAKAGSGDVLAGTIAGLLALGEDPFEAAVLGVHLHGTAGDRIRARKGPHGLFAGELAREIGYLSAGESAQEIGYLSAGEQAQEAGYLSAGERSSGLS